MIIKVKIKGVFQILLCMFLIYFSTWDKDSEYIKRSTARYSIGKKLTCTIIKN